VFRPQHVAVLDGTARHGTQLQRAAFGECACGTVTREGQAAVEVPGKGRSEGHSVAVLRSVTIERNVAELWVLCCAVLYCAVLCCAVLCCAVLCCTVLCCAVLCCAVLCCTALHCTALYCTVLYCTVLY
jgi:hypothetical protein